jgi:branched-chain amino acid transport system substrate-binding protein
MGRWVSPASVARGLAGLLATVGLATGMAACGSGSGTSAASSRGSDSGAGKSASGATELRIGWIGANSGPYAAYGRTMREGAELAISRINGAGGFAVGTKKYTFKLVPRDTAGDPDQALAATKRLVEQDKTRIILGLSGSTEATAIEPYWATQKDKLLVATDSTYRGPLFQQPNAFRVSGAQIFLDMAAVEQATKLGIKSVAILTDATHAGLMGTRAATVQAFQKAGINVVDNETYPSDTYENFSSTVTKLQSKKPDLVFIRSIFQAPLMFAKQAKQLGLKSMLMTDIAQGPDEVKKIVPPNVVDGMWVATNLTALDLASLKVPGASQFVDEFKKKFNEDPGQFSVNGYAGVHVLMDAMKTAGTVSDVAKLQTTLDTMKPPDDLILPVKAWPDGKLFGSDYNEANVSIGVSKWSDGDLTPQGTVSPTL